MEKNEYNISFWKKLQLTMQKTAPDIKNIKVQFIKSESGLDSSVDVNKVKSYLAKTYFYHCSIAVDWSYD